jgi:hypothetical protein
MFPFEHHLRRPNATKLVLRSLKLSAFLLRSLANALEQLIQSTHDIYSNMAPLDAITSLAIAELTIYILLLPAIIYILVRHGRHGIEGWAFLIVFAILRLVSSGIQVANRNSTSTTGSIINSVGISGLLLSLSGVIHEA